MRFFRLGFIYVFFSAFFVFPTSALTSANAQEAAHVTLSPHDDGHWRADFRLSTPTTQLALNRPSKGGRAKRWRFLEPGFEIDDEDVIRRMDGATFQEVSIIEPTTLEDPIVGYIPFAQFGDGGLLIYTGRFQACAVTCPASSHLSSSHASARDAGSWRFTVHPGAKQRMVINGASASGPVSFVNTGDGSKIYVGDGNIIQGRSLLAVVDRALPGSIASNLDDLFPRLMRYYSERLGRPKAKQMLFASYNVPGGHSGHRIKGGSLPNQVFMHFEGAGVEAMAAEDDFTDFLAFFFAHEAAHLHQKHHDAPYDEADSWIHEGAADAFAYLALRDLGVASPSYLTQRLDDATDRCGDAITDGPLRGVHERGPFQAYYDCGMLLHLAAGAASQSGSGDDLFALWKTFRMRVVDGAPWNDETYIQVIRESAGGETAAFARQILDGALDGARGDTKRALNAGLTKSGFQRPFTSSPD